MPFFREPVARFIQGAGLLIDSYAPQLCLFCDQPSHRSAPLCDICREALTLNSGACPGCALPECTGALCPACQSHPPPLRIVAPWVYNHAMAHLLHRWKYNGERHLGAATAFLALELPGMDSRHKGSRVQESQKTEARGSDGPAGPEKATATPTSAQGSAAPATLPTIARASGPETLALSTPLHWRRRLQRGFNQSEDLLRAVRRHSPGIALTCANARAVHLRRRRATARQALAARSDRLRNLRGAFHVEGDIDGRPVLLVDDVCTTGATGVAMATVLRDAGAGAVTLWCLARTPAR